MKRFDVHALKPGDILAVRNMDRRDKIAPLIRAVLGSVTNHNALFIFHNTAHEFMIGDTLPPRARKRPLYEYERKINDGTYWVRVWRVKRLTDDERMSVSINWQWRCDGQDYPELGVCRLWIMRLVNELPYEIKGHWCTKNTLAAFDGAVPLERHPAVNPFEHIMKYNPTPRTMENRLAAGMLEDVTDQVLVDVGANPFTRKRGGE